MANDYAINYEDERFGQVESDKNQAMTELENTYGGMINESDKYYQAQIDASKQWADQQSQLQQERTDFTIEQVNQQKDQAKKDYTKEQSGAYVDWQKQSNQYGVEAERQASVGMTGTGFSESSQVGMYNTYQNRVATARESYNRAVLNYDNAIKDARLQNNAALAEIAYKSLQQQLELSLQGFQYKNQLVLEQTKNKLEVDNMYYNRYLDVLNQINTENALAEEIRQYNESMAWDKYQFNFENKLGEFAPTPSASAGGYKGGTGAYVAPKVKDDTGTETKPEGLVVVNSPLSVEGAAKGIAEGKYNATQVGNAIYLSNNPNYVKGQSALDKYTSLINTHTSLLKK